MEKTKKKQLNPLAIIISVLLAVYMITMASTLLWTLLTTLKSKTEYMYYDNGTGRLGNILWFPKKITFENFINAYTHFFVEVEIGDGYYSSFNIFQQFGNSLLYSVGCAAAGTIASLVMGYATARFKYKFSEYIYTFVLITMALPIVGSMPSEIAVTQSLNLFDTMPGIWILRANFLSTYFLIFYAQFKMIPKDYTEAAKIDGANPLSIMLQIIVPLASTTTTTVFVLSFITFWNDFQIPMVYIPSYPVAAYGMFKFQTTPIKEIAHTPARLAGICLLAFPIVIFYAFFNKKLNVNLSVGGIKG